MYTRVRSSRVSPKGVSNKSVKQCLAVRVCVRVCIRVCGLHRASLLVAARFLSSTFVVCLFVCLFVCSFVRWLVGWFVRSFVRLFARLLFSFLISSQLSLPLPIWAQIDSAEPWVEELEEH